MITDADVARIPYTLRARLLTVDDAVDLTPTMRRFAFTGETEEFPHLSLAPAEHIRVVLPDADGGIRLPTIDEGRPSFPAGRPVMRDYTVRSVDARGRIVLDMITSHDGPAAQWARDAVVGSTLGLLGPRASVVMPRVDHYTLLGDESALPALQRWLEEAPPHARVDAIALVPEGSRGPLPEHPGAQVRWADTPQDALDALEAIEMTPATWFWAAGEATLLTRVRALVDSRGVPRRHRRIEGYWRHGEADFDHHTPLDDAS